MARFYGGLARSGKVKNQTPHQEKTSAVKKYSSNKFREAVAASGSSKVEEKKFTFPKYNTMEGWDKLEFIHEKKEQTLQREKNSNYRSPGDTNHKKWHRNHPKEGFYQSRQTIENL